MCECMNMKYGIMSLLYFFPACPDEFVAFGGKCFKESQRTFADYAEAKQECVANDSLPASLADPDVYYFVSSLLY